MARSLRSLRQVATLRHGHMARLAPAFRALGVCEHIWLRYNNISFLNYLGLNCRGTQLSTPKFNLFWDSICFGTQLSLFAFGTQSSISPSITLWKASTTLPPKSQLLIAVKNLLKRDRLCLSQVGSHFQHLHEQ